MGKSKKSGKDKKAEKKSKGGSKEEQKKKLTDSEQSEAKKPVDKKTDKKAEKKQKSSSSESSDSSSEDDKKKEQKKPEPKKEEKKKDTPKKSEEKKKGEKKKKSSSSSSSSDSSSSEEEKPAKGVKRKAEEKQVETPDAKKQKTETPTKTETQNESSGEVKDLVSKNWPYTTTEDDIKEFFKDIGDVQIRLVNREGQFRGVAFLTCESIEAQNKALALNGTEFNGRNVAVEIAYDRNAGGGGGRGDRGGRGERGGRGGRGGRTERTAKPEGCTTVYVGNVSFQIEDQHVYDFFADCGEVTSIRWLNHKDTGNFRGAGFVDFSTTEATDKAVAKTGQDILGRAVRVDYAAERQ